MLNSLLRLAALLAVAWLLASALMFLMQERLLYLPNIGGRALVATPTQIGLEWEDVAFITAGAAIAARQATHTPPAALILESAFTSVPTLAAQLYPIFPVRTLARLDYNTKHYVIRSDAQVPIMVVHSPDDEIIPWSHGEALLAAADKRGTLLQLRGDHNTGFLMSGEIYRDGLREFIQTRLPRHAAHRQH